MNRLNTISERRVMVSNPGKQYVHQLLMGLQKNNFKVDFYTSFWYKPNNFPFSLLSFFPRRYRIKLEAEFKKRYYEGLKDTNIFQRPWFELLREISDKLFGNRFSERMQFKRDRLHDQWVASKLDNCYLDNCYDVVIAYEESSLLTFRKAKDLGITTVLDLAQIHYKEIELLADRYDVFKDIYSNKELRNTINVFKEEELQLADYIVCLSEYAKATLVKRGFLPSRIFIANLGFDPKLFIPKSSYSKSGKLKVIFVGTMTQRKGIDLLLKVSRELSDRMELILVGPMADADDLLNSYKGSYTWHPYVDHASLVQLLHSSDLFVFPSYLDSWAMVVVEAMACGLPVIVSENTGAKEVVVEGTGFIVPVGDSEAIKEKISYFYKNRDQLENMGKEARNASLTYTWERYHRTIKDILEEIRK